MGGVPDQLAIVKLDKPLSDCVAFVETFLRIAILLGINVHVGQGAENVRLDLHVGDGVDIL